LAVTTPVLLALGLLFSVASMISYVVQEKELRQKELMKMMSVTECDIEWSWFITFMGFNIIAASCCTLVSGFLFPYSSPYLLWIFWVFTFLALTLFCTAIAAYNSKATRGVLLGLLCFFSGLFPSIIFPIQTSPPAVIAIIMLHPVATFSYGITILGGLDDLALGLTSETVDFVHGDLDYSFQKILMAYTYSCLLWSLATWYWNRTVKPEYGQALFPYWFPCSASYWKSVWARPPPSVQQDHKNGETTTTTATAMSLSQPPSYDVTGAAAAGGVVDEDVDTTMCTAAAIPIEPVSASLHKQSRNGESIEIMDLHKSFGIYPCTMDKSRPYWDIMVRIFYIYI
jgi:hypothetical protein